MRLNKNLYLCSVFDGSLVYSGCLIKFAENSITLKGFLLNKSVIQNGNIQSVVVNKGKVYSSLLIKCCNCGTVSEFKIWPFSFNDLMRHLKSLPTETV